MTEKDLEIQELRMRLKAYEATGLEPEEIEEAMSTCAETLAENQFAIKEINELGGVAHLRELVQAEAEKNEPPTNADRIRAMSDEKLAEWLTALSWSSFAIGIAKMNAPLLKETERLEWLKLRFGEEEENG